MVTTSAWIDGRPASADALCALALCNYGHFTTLQVRGGAVRGLDLHLRRLCEANRELFGSALDPGRVRDQLRRALEAAGTGDCSLRATVFAPGFDAHRAAAAAARTLILVAISPPQEPGAAPLRVRSYRYRRPAPHLKHVGTFPLLHHRRMAMEAGYDDALFVDEGRRVLEGSLWNIGFLHGDTVVWPEGPALRGVAERLLQAGLAQAGVAQATRPVLLDELADFGAAFACNSRGLRLIAGVDAAVYAPQPGFARMLAATLAASASQRI